MSRLIGSYRMSSPLEENAQALVPFSLPQTEPAQSWTMYDTLNLQTEVALACLPDMSDIALSVDWMPYAPIGTEALSTFQIELAAV